MPIDIVFTKFEVFVSRLLFDIAGGDTRHHERARARANIMYREDSSHILTRTEVSTSGSSVKAQSGRRRVGPF